MSHPVDDLPTRRDVVRNRAAILRAASELLTERDALTVADVAERAGVSRATVYRHFASVSVLLEEAAQRARPEPSAAPAPAPGGLPDIGAALSRVPPHLLPEQIVSEAERLGGLGIVALYLVDIDGSRLLQAAGARDLPDELPIPLAVGPEIPPEGYAALRESVVDLLPNVTVAPIETRGRAIGVLIAVDDHDRGVLEALARQAGIALVMGERFTDVISAARRRRETTASAEIQQMLLPPRIVRLSGLDLAANVVPGYENGGNWFDHAENGDGAWIAAVDTMGSGSRAAAISSVALGALRSRRHAGSTPVDAAAAIDECLRAIGLPDARCALFVARWHGPTSTLFHVSAGGLTALHVRPDGAASALPTSSRDPVGAGGVPTRTEHVRLRPGDRIVLVSDAISGSEDSALAPGRLDEVFRELPAATPARTVRAIELAIETSAGQLADDAMSIVFAPSVVDGR